jgi:SAM-dependent methyltransferase
MCVRDASSDPPRLASPGPPSYRARESLTWVEGNAEQLPFEDGSFDLYTIAFGLRNVTNRCVCEWGGVTNSLCLENLWSAARAARRGARPHGWSSRPPASHHAHTCAHVHSLIHQSIHNSDKALAEAFRVLKRGGRFMCLEFSHVALPVAREAYDLYSFEVGEREEKAPLDQSCSRWAAARVLTASKRSLPLSPFSFS